MKTFHWTLGLAAALVAGPALAADLPSTKAPPVYAPPPPAFSWSGFYLDAAGGYGEWSANTSTAVAGINQIQGGRGFLGRVGGGFDYQFTDHLVAGVFGDGTFGRMTGIIQDAGAGVSGSPNQNWSWAAGGRLGWLLTPDLLVYGNAGFTQAHFTSATLYGSFTGAFTGNSTPGFNADGWFAGIGAETMFAPGWFWRTEYRFADYGGRDLADTGALGPLGNIHFHPIVQTITSGVVYKFGWPDFNAPGIPSFTQITDGFGPAPAATNWTGIYADAGIGYGIWSANTSVFDPITGGCLVCAAQRQGGRGVYGSVGAGYDYQLTNKIVAGVLGEFNPSDLRGTLVDQADGLAGSISQNWAWAAGGRLGWLVSPAVMTYVKAGFTQARFGGAGLQSAFTGAASGISTAGFTADGWFLGGGIEAEFAPGWFWRADYRYAEYGSHDLPELGAGLPTTIHFRPEEQSATLGLVYKFNWAAPAPAPLVTKY